MGRPVDDDASAVQPTRKRLHARRVSAVKIGLQSVGSVVGDRHSLVVVVIGDHRQDWSENFLARDAHLVSDASEYGWLREPTTVQSGGPSGTACQDARAFFQSEFDIGLNPIILLLADHRANHGIRVARGANLERLDLLLQPGKDAVEQMLWNQDTRAGDASLAAVDEAHSQDGWDDHVKIGVVEDDVRSFAAKLQGDALERVGCISAGFPCRPQ